MTTPLRNCRLGLYDALSTVLAVCLLTGTAFSQGYAPQGPAGPVPSVQWETDIDVAMARAEREQRPLFLHFVGNDSQPARQMSAEVFSQPAIAARLNATFVMVHINASENGVLAQKFSVTSIPTDIVLKPNGQLVHRRTGGIPAERFNNYITFIQDTLQSDRNSLTGTAPIAGPQPAPAQREMQRETPPLSHSIVSPSIVNDPFAPQVAHQPPPMVPQPPAAPPAAPPVNHNPNHNPLRSGETAAMPTTMQTTMPTAMPAPASAAIPSLAAVMSGVPAPAKMTVEVPLALEGYCPVTLCSEEKWVSGNPAFCTMYQGHIFRFATSEAMMTFVRNPADYMPVALGEDIVLLVDRNKRVNGNRQFGLWCQGRVFLFASQETLNTFAERPDYYTEIAMKYESARKEQVQPMVY